MLSLEARGRTAVQTDTDCPTYLATARGHGKASSTSPSVF